MGGAAFVRRQPGALRWAGVFSCRDRCGVFPIPRWSRGAVGASAQHPEFHWVNTILGNVKSALRSTYHSFRPKYAQRYLSEFEYRFNRRFHLPELIPRLAYVALRTPPMPDKLLKLGVA